MKSFQKKMPENYYTTTIVSRFNFLPDVINYNVPIYQRNPESIGCLTLNHIEFIEFFVRLIKPRNFIELGVQYGELTNHIINLIPNLYIGVDIKRDSNINYLEQTFPSFKFIELTTNDFFDSVRSTNLNIEMGLIDACHSHEASYQDFLNLKEHIVDDGIIFLHDTYPYSEKWTSSILCGDAYKTAEKIRKEHNHEFEILTLPINPGISVARKIRKQCNWL